ncbi:MAG: hypothetical protein JNG84_00255 [Archangium sp.]|nr:hypothetical protein [Archangium sp.]
MAAKKKAAAPKAAAKKKLTAPVKKKSKLRPTPAVKLLDRAQLPGTKLRDLFRASFTDDQCRSWGEKTKAVNVLAACAQWLPLIDKGLSKAPRFAYSPQRFAWLLECVVALEDEVERTTNDGADEAVGLRSYAASRATQERNGLLDGLMQVAAGRADLRPQITQRTGDVRTLDGLESSLAGLLDLATRWHKRDDLSLLCDDADLGEERLNRAWNALEALHQATEVTNRHARNEGDAESVNLIEGRVLREMKLAMRAFDRARASSLDVPALVVPPSLKHTLDRTASDDAETPIPDPAATPTS